MRKNTLFKVGKDAEAELKATLEAAVERTMAMAAKFAQIAGRKTILERDIMDCFCYAERVWHIFGGPGDD
jgi:histone H3/H4